MLRRPTYLFLAVSLAAGVAGCASGSSGGTAAKTPKGELAAGIDGLGHTDVLTTALHLDADVATLRAFARSQGSSISAADAATLTGAQVVVEVKTLGGEDISEVKSGGATNVDFRGVVNGHTLVELRVVGGDLYIQGDVRGILGLAHKEQLYGEVKARAASLPQFVQAAAAGKWVSLNGAAAQGLAGNLGATTSGGDKSSSAQQMLADLRRIVDRDVTVTSAGSDDRGDHLVVSGHTRKIAADLLAVTNSTVPGASAATSRVDPSKVKDRVVTLDAWVKDGHLSAVSLNLSQFGDTAHPGAPVAITIDFAQSGDDISAPQGATPVDLTQLGTLLGALK